MKEFLDLLHSSIFFSYRFEDHGIIPIISIQIIDAVRGCYGACFENTIIVGDRRLALRRRIKGRGRGRSEIRGVLVSGGEVVGIGGVLVGRRLVNGIGDGLVGAVSVVGKGGVLVSCKRVGRIRRVLGGVLKSFTIRRVQLGGERRGERLVGMEGGNGCGYRGAGLI